MVNLPVTRTKFAAFGQLSSPISFSLGSRESSDGMSAMNLFAQVQYPFVDLLRFVPTFGATLRSLIVSETLLSSRWMPLCAAAFGCTKDEPRVGSLSNLRVLELSLYSSSHEDSCLVVAKGISRTCPLLTRLKLSGGPKDWSAIFEALSTLKHLETLVTAASVAEAQWGSLRSLRKLTELHVMNRGFMASPPRVVQRIVDENLAFVALYDGPNKLVFSNNPPLLLLLLDAYAKSGARITRATAAKLTVDSVVVSAAASDPDGDDKLLRQPALIAAFRSDDPLSVDEYIHVLNRVSTRISLVDLLFSPFIAPGATELPRARLPPFLVCELRRWLGKRPLGIQPADVRLLRLIPDLLTPAEHLCLLIIDELFEDAVELLRSYAGRGAVDSLVLNGTFRTVDGLSSEPLRAILRESRVDRKLQQNLVLPKKNDAARRVLESELSSIYNAARESRPAKFAEFAASFERLVPSAVTAFPFVESGVLFPLPAVCVQKLLELATSRERVEILRKVCTPEVVPLLKFPQNYATVSLAQVAVYQSLGLIPHRACLEWVIRQAEAEPVAVESIMERSWADAKAAGKFSPLFDGLLGFSILIPSVTAVKYFLKKGVEFERTSLHFAVQPSPEHSGNPAHAEIIQILIDNGADLEAEEPTSGETPLFRAGRAGNNSMVQLLLSKYRPNLHSKRGSILSLCKSPSPDVVALLPADIVNRDLVQVSNLPYLHHWYFQGRFPKLTEILPKRSDWDLLVVHPQKNISFLQYLAEHVLSEDDLRALIEYIPKYAPRLACTFLPILGAGVARGLSKNSFCGKTHLSSFIKLAKENCPNSFDIDNREHSRLARTALHEVCVSGDEDAIREVLSCGASVSLLDSDNRTPLILMAMGGSRVFVAELVVKTNEAGLLSHKDKSGAEALSYFRDKMDVAELLQVFAAAGITLSESELNATPPAGATAMASLSKALRSTKRIPAPAAPVAPVVSPSLFRAPHHSTAFSSFESSIATSQSQGADPNRAPAPAPSLTFAPLTGGTQRVPSASPTKFSFGDAISKNQLFQFPTGNISFSSPSFAQNSAAQKQPADPVPSPDESDSPATDLKKNK